MRSTLPGALLVLMLSLAPLQAQERIELPDYVKAELVTPLLERLEAEGFTIVEIKRTWLGRILILSSNGEYLRETVLNRRSGEILRDRRFDMPRAGQERQMEKRRGTPGKMQGANQDMSGMTENVPDGTRKPDRMGSGSDAGQGGKPMNRGMNAMGSGPGG